MASEAAFRSVHNTRRCSSPDIASAPTGHCPPFTWKYTRVLSCRRMNRSAQSLTDQHQRPFGQDSLAEWSKALAPGASPQGRGFEPHSCHFSFTRHSNVRKNTPAAGFVDTWGPSTTPPGSGLHEAGLSSPLGVRESCSTYDFISLSPQYTDSLSWASVEVSTIRPTTRWIIHLARIELATFSV